MTTTRPNSFSDGPLCRPALAVGWEIFRRQRATFLSICGVILACAIYRWMCFYPNSKDAFPSICILLMGLSLAWLFLLFKFTETEGRERFSGFPSRLFTLPVRTVWLVSCPMFYGVAAVVLVYAAWAALVLGPMVPQHFPIVFPALYLATGMICFQAVVWALARFPITRLVVLGIWGTALATSWISFSPTLGNSQMGSALARTLHLSVRTTQMGILVALSVVAYVLACWSVARQRRGASPNFTWLGARAIRAKFLAASPKPFTCLRAAQFWFEWRRNGILLPLITGAILLLIVAPFFVRVPYTGREHGGVVGITLSSMVILPLALAFIIGQGFGKTNFSGEVLGSELGLPFYLAVRPITAEDWLAVKLKTAAVSALATWLLTAWITAVWLVTCCDCTALLPLWMGLTPPVFARMSLFALAIFLGLASLVTWRLLVTNLFVGILGSKAAFNAAFCMVLVAIFAPFAFAGWLSAHPRLGEQMKPLLHWLPWILAALFVFKCGLAVRFCRRAIHLGLISKQAAITYVAFWVWATEFLLLLVTLVPAGGSTKSSLVMGALLFLPMARISFAPLAFVRNRHR